MNDRDLLWVTDRQLQVTQLSARLRDMLRLDGEPITRLHVSELWSSTDPFSIASIAHRWALEGEPIDFETVLDNRTFQVRLEPLIAPAGSIDGVIGRASEAQAESGIKARLDALAHAEDATGFGSWHVHLQTSTVTASRGLALLLGVPPDERIPDIRAFDHHDDAGLISAAMRQGEISGTGYACEHRIIRADGAIRHVNERVRTLYDEAGAATAQVGSLLDITEHKQREAQLEHLAHYDPLTKLPNRALLEERLRAAVARAQRTRSTCGVLYIDLDKFKQVNDTYGHPAGDALLELVGRRLERHVRASDLVARPSGDEFVVVLEDLHGEDDALDAARNVLRSFDDPFLMGERSIRVHASIGIATYPGSAGDVNGLIVAADRAMYVLKRNGGRGVKLAVREETPTALTEKVACVRRSPVRLHSDTRKRA